MIRPRPEQVVRFAAVVVLFALACMVWSLVDPRPVPIMVAMSVGQALGTLSLLLYVGVIVVEARRATRGGRQRQGEAPGPTVNGATMDVTTDASSDATDATTDAAAASTGAANRRPAT